MWRCHETTCFKIKRTNHRKDKWLYILLARKHPSRTAPGPHRSNQSIIANIIPRKLDCGAPLLQAASEAPTSGGHGSWHPGGEGRSRNSGGVWDWNQAKVTTLFNVVAASSLLMLVKKDTSNHECMAHEAKCPVVSRRHLFNFKTLN